MNKIKNMVMDGLNRLRDKKVRMAIISYIPVVLGAFGISLLPEQLDLIETVVMGILAGGGLLGILYGTGNKKGGE